MSSLPDGLSETSRQQLSIHFYDWLDTRNQNVGFKLGISPSDCLKEDYDIILCHWDFASCYILFSGNYDGYEMDFVIKLPKYKEVIKIPYFYAYASFAGECSYIGNDIRDLPYTQSEMEDYIDWLDKMVRDVKNGKLFRMMAIGKLIEYTDIGDYYLFINSLDQETIDTISIDSFMRDAEEFTIEALGEDKIIEEEEKILDAFLKKLIIY